MWAVASKLRKKWFKGNWIGRLVQAFWMPYKCTSCWLFLNECSIKWWGLWPGLSLLMQELRVYLDISVIGLNCLFQLVFTCGIVPEQRTEGLIKHIILHILWEYIEIEPGDEDRTAPALSSWTCGLKHTGHMAWQHAVWQMLMLHYAISVLFSSPLHG